MLGGKRFIGLVKFFRNSDFLEELVGGHFYCNTPEYYRMSEQEGVSDKHESCIEAYRSERGDAPVKLEVNGHEFTSLHSYTIHGPGYRDHWMHCWMVLSIPDTNEGIDKLLSDIHKMRLEFGREFAFLHWQNIPEVAERLRSSTSLNLSALEVQYSDDRMDWSATCKAREYEYQREYRFLFGECSHACVEPKSIKSKAGFADLIMKNPSIVLTNEYTGEPWFSLTEDDCVADHDAVPTVSDSYSG